MKDKIYNDFMDFADRNSSFAEDLIDNFGADDGEKDDEPYINDALDNAFDYLWHWDCERMANGDFVEAINAYIAEQMLRRNAKKCI